MYEFRYFFNLLVVVFTVSNLASMGLELNIKEVRDTLKSARTVVIIAMFGWVIGPMIA